jgi:hypothetical protein
MKTLVFSAGLLLTTTALVLAMAPTASATLCAVEDTGCVCVVNLPPGQGCGNGSAETGCFVSVGLDRSNMIGVGCVN